MYLIFITKKKNRKLLKKINIIERLLLIIKGSNMNTNKNANKKIDSTSRFYAAVFGLELTDSLLSLEDKFYAFLHLRVHYNNELFKDCDERGNLTGYKPDQQKRALHKVGSALIGDEDYMRRHGINKIYLCQDTEMYARPFGRGAYLLLATTEDFDEERFTGNRSDTLDFFEEIKISTEIKINTPTHTRSVDTSSVTDFPSLGDKEVTNDWVKPLAIRQEAVLSPVTTVDDTLTAVTTQSIDSSLKTALEYLSKGLFTKKELGRILFDLDEEPLNNLLGNLTEATVVIYDNGLVKQDDNCQQPCHGQVPYGYYGPVPVPVHGPMQHQIYDQRLPVQTNGCDETSIQSMGSANM